MNWITRCPECATVYQVLPDQRQAAKGWLRCGQCQHAFDSTGLILAWPGGACAKVSSTAPVVQKQEGSNAQRLDIDDLLKQEDCSAVNAPSNASLDLCSFEQALSSFQPEIEKAIVKMAATPPESQDSLDDFHELTIDAASPERIRRQWLSVWILCALALGLFAQWVWIERFALVARFPALDSHIQRVCSLWACDLPRARDLHGVVIDTSSFIQREDGFELQWVVRNATERTVLMTALDVTLEDAQGKPVVRRAFLPAELGAPQVLTPEQVWPGVMRLTVSGDTVVTGYRILSFYP